ncbi:hypothetical protein QN277_023994 [Acacia crassicarpa]|uniref:RING-type E3 ubiquitin transferase n=1 Tax=Acacia crassicarpa TaxID=499986 RepID=A0AAE1JER1_9FABA|nr:hypothetical protein QN277_023994 [Acacia crassicarpa]
MEAYSLQDLYEWAIHPWGEAPYYLGFDFLDGNPTIPPPDSDDRYFNIRTFLNERTILNEDYRLCSPAYTHSARYDFFNLPYKSIKQAINYILSILNVPESIQKPMATQILTFADNMANNTHRSFRTMFMIVMVDATIFYRHNDNCDGASNDNCDGASTKKLKGLKFQQKEEEESDCIICCQNFKDDVVQMPCSHFFHGNCLVGWLLKKNNCPLCRFELKT